MTSVTVSIYIFLRINGKIKIKIRRVIGEDITSNHAWPPFILSLNSKTNGIIELSNKQINNTIVG